MRRKLIGITITSLFLSGLIAFHMPPASAKPKTKTIRGYVTDVTSPTSFEIEDYKIMLSGNYEVDLKNVPQGGVKFDPETHIKVGTLLKIKCELDSETGEVLSIKKVTLDLEQFRQRSHTVVLQEAPTELVKQKDGSWVGKVLADGRRIQINSDTNVRFKLNKAEKEKAGEEKEEEEDTENDAEVESPDSKSTEAEKSESESAEAAEDDVDNETNVNWLSESGHLERTIVKSQ